MSINLAPCCFICSISGIIGYANIGGKVLSLLLLCLAVGYLSNSLSSHPFARTSVLAKTFGSILDKDYRNK